MSDRSDPNAQSYDSFFREFDSPLMRQIRQEAYGGDIGQHSWVTVEELRADMSRLQLSMSSRLLDLGCGPGGPLTFVLKAIGCQGTGIELSASALSLARAQAISLGVDRLATLQQGDLNEQLPVEESSFDAAMSLDVILHVRDRSELFREVARALAPGRKFLFTDAGVIAGSISADEVALRSIHGHTQFTAPGFNERMLERAGFRLLEIEDRTSSVLKSAGGRLAARLAHREQLERLEGASSFERQQLYLETVIQLSHRRAVLRTMYLAESRSV